MAVTVSMPGRARIDGVEIDIAESGEGRPLMFHHRRYPPVWSRTGSPRTARKLGTCGCVLAATGTGFAACRRGNHSPKNPEPAGRKLRKEKGNWEV